MQNLTQQNAQQPPDARLEAPNANKKNRKNKKNKNKGKTETGAGNEQNNGQAKIVTLRNPLFQGNDTKGMPPTAPSQQRNQAQMNMNQPASIIKNDNGMFTIRNMALQSTMVNGGMGPNYMRPYPSEVYQPPADNYSYFSGNPINSTSAIPTNPSEQLQAMEANSTPFYGVQTSNAAIGSEMKYAQQMKNTTGRIAEILLFYYLLKQFSSVQLIRNMPNVRRWNMQSPRNQRLVADDNRKTMHVVIYSII